MPRNFQKLNAELGAEFDRYVVEHPTWALKNIPQGARVAFQLEGNTAFNAWSQRLVEQTDTPNQPIIFVCIKKLAPIRSRIMKADVQRAA
jgi:hypothetical protein